MHLLEFEFIIVCMAPKLSVKKAILEKFVDISRSMAHSRAVSSAVSDESFLSV